MQHLGQQLSYLLISKPDANGFPQEQPVHRRR